SNKPDSGDWRDWELVNVSEYAHVPNRSIESFEDVDQDGRPDLIVQGDFRLQWLDCAGFSGPDDLVPLVAHSQPDGRFSLTDEVAKTHVRKLCPEAPRSIPDYEANGDFEPWKTVHNVVCARVWGVSPDEVLDALSTECLRYESFDDCTELPDGMTAED